jgi:hypothetical protein
MNIIFVAMSLQQLILVSLFLTCLLLLTVLTTLFFLSVCLLGLISLLLLYLGWNPTCLIVPSMSTLKTLSLLYFKFSMVFLKDLLWNFFSSFYTPRTPLSTVISNPSANLHLCAEYRYSQRFLSSSAAADVAYNISHLEHIISNVYNWMSSDFLSLNPFKSEFFLVDLPQQLSKLSTPIIHLPTNIALSPLHFGISLGAIFDSNLTFYEHNSVVSKSCFYYIRQWHIL